jgi:hypothetical protein
VPTRASPRRAQGGAAAADDEDVEEAAARLAISLGDLPPVNPDWAVDPLKMDVFHFLAHLNAIATHKSNALFGIFTVVLAMCIFKPMPGEYARVLECAKKRWPQLRADPSKISTIPWRFFRKHMRYVCPDPVTIMLALQAAFLCFSKVIDPGSGKSFLLGTWRSLLRTQLKYVAAGLLSDCPSVSMYMAMRKMACGLIIYRCLRGSSALEGYHAHLRRLLEHCYSASDETRDAIVNCFDFRFNVRAARAASLFDPNVKHFNMSLLDEIDSLLLALGMQGLELHRQVADKPALMVHGSHFSKLALEQEGAKIDAAAAAEGGEEALCKKQWKLVPDSADKAALIAHACFSAGTAGELCDVARSRHIFWSADDAERFKQAVALGEAKQAALAAAGLAALHVAQRVPATAPDALMVPAAAALPAPAGGALMPLAPPIHSAGAGAAGAPRHDPAARAIGPALPMQPFAGPVLPAAALGAAAGAGAAHARKRGAPRKAGGGSDAEEKRRRNREYARTSRERAEKKAKKASDGADGGGGAPE